MADKRAWNAPGDIEEALDLAVELAKEGKLGFEETELIAYKAGGGDPGEFLDRLEERLEQEGLEV